MSLKCKIFGYMIYEDTWSMARDEYKCLNCNFNIINDYKWYYECIFNKKYTKVKKFNRIFLQNRFKRCNIPLRLSKYRGFIIPNKSLTKFMINNKV